MATTTVAPRGGIEIGGTAPVVVTHGGGQVDSGIVVEWDFDNDGDFDGPDEDITGLVLGVETLTGRDFPSQLTGRAGPGQLKVSLLNTDDRFSFFNQASPLNQDGNSLRTGRKVRVRTTDAVNADPVLLARDRFNRPDGPLTTDETGKTWGLPVGAPFSVAPFAVQGGRAAATAPNVGAVGNYALLDVAATDHYVQAVAGPLYEGSLAGVIVRYTDPNNFTLAYLSRTGGLSVDDIDAGVGSTVASYAFTPWAGVTFGCQVDGTTVTGYVAGVPVCTATLPGPVNGTQAGIYAAWDPDVSTQALDDFHVWDRVASEVEGVLWTGDISDLRPVVGVADLKVAGAAGEGWLARAALPDVASPRVPGGAKTGLLAGDTLARAGLLHPPGVIDEGAVTAGPVGIPDGNALELARLFEETERGFIHETNEGPVGFQDATARAGATSQAHFSDTPSVGQFRFREIAPYDQRREVINRVTAGVAPSAPAGITRTVRTSNVPILSTNHCDVVLPTTAAGDLLVVVIIRANQSSGQEWNVPIWWVEHRPAKDAINTRIYSHWCDGTESGDTIRFYSDVGPAGGAWIAHIIQIEDWYQSYAGVAVGEFVQGADPEALVHGWDREATLFVAVHGANQVSGSAVGTTYPDGYGDGATNIFTTNGNVLLSTAWKVDVTEFEDPGPFTGSEGFLISESVVFAVRGFNGPHTKATLDQPQTTGGAGRFVTVEDVDSQDAHNTIRSHVSASNLLATETAAEQYGQAVLVAHADDRPIITLTFIATLDAAHRAQAIRRRVGDKITVTATGATGLGVQGDFFIESVGHKWSAAGKHWECSWELSPA